MLSLRFNLKGIRARIRSRRALQPNRRSLVVTQAKGGAGIAALVIALYFAVPAAIRAFNTILVMSPSGLFAILLMPFIAFLLGHGKDARWIILSGLIVMGAGNYWMSQLNLSVSPGLVVWSRVVTIVGLSMCFAPLNVAAYLYTPQKLRGAAVGLLSLLHTEGGSVGTSLAQTLHERLDQFHTLRLGEYLDPFNPAAHAFLHHVGTFFLRQTGDPALSKQIARQGLEILRRQQASSLAYFDCFWGFAVIVLALVPLVFLMKRSVAEKGVHIGAE